jgi:hypothetical protein
MEDLGPPIAWLALEEGTPVYDRNGERVGVAERALGERDIFEGVIVHTLPLPGHHLFADVEQIAELHERGVLLSVERDALHEPPPEGSARKPRRAESGSQESGLEARLRRAWDWLANR